MKASHVKCLFIAFLLVSRGALSMLSKNKRPYNPDVLPPPERLRRNVQDIAGDQLLSGARTMELTRDIAANGVRGFRRLKVKTRNVFRFRKRLMKHSKWPDVYWACIRVNDPKTQQERRQRCAFFLPHELLQTLARQGDAAALYDVTNMDIKTKEHLEYCVRQAGCPLIGLGLWCDGCPCNWDRTKSVETVSLNLPGLAGEHASMRIPIVSILRDHIGENTFDDIMDIIQWSLHWCALGTGPPCRHDNRAFDARYGDKRRKPSQPLLTNAALCEVRGDWKMMSEVFKLPKHNENAGICWSCPCTPQEVVFFTPGVALRAVMGPSGP